MKIYSQPIHLLAQLMTQNRPDGPWEAIVLPYPPERLTYGVTLTIQFVAGRRNVVFGTTCQGITADGTTFAITLVDSMFIEGGNYTAGTFVVIIAGIAYEDAATLVRIVHSPEQQG